MGHRELKVVLEGTGFTSSSTSAATAIPVDSTGDTARSILVTAQGLTYIMPGSSAVAATNESIIIGAGEQIVLNVQGLTHVASLELTAAQRVTMTPVE